MRRSAPVLTLLVLAACGGNQTHGEVPVAPAELTGCDLLGLLPDGFSTVLHADLGAIREAPLYALIGPSLEEWRRALERMAPPGRPGPAELWTVGERTQWVVYAARPAPIGQPPESLVLLGADLDEPAVRAMLRMWETQASDMPSPLEVEPPRLGPDARLKPQEGESHIEQLTFDRELERRERRGRTVFVLGDNAAAELEDGTWVTGTNARVDALVDRWQGRGRNTACRSPIELSPEFVQASGFFDHELTWLSRDPLMLAGVGNAQEGAPPSPHSEVYGGRVEVETSLRFTLRIRTRDAARATERAAEIRQDAREAGQEEGVTVLGLDRLLSQVDPRVEGSDVVLQSSLNPLQAYLLWGRISGVVGAGLVALETFRDFFGGMAGGLLERLPIGP